jgi:translation initiation factor 1
MTDSIQFNNIMFQTDINMLDDLGNGDFKKQRPVSNIHIRIKQRSAKKTITIIEGLAEDLDLKKIAKVLRRQCKVMASVITKDGETVIQMSGDQRETVKRFLIDMHVWEEPDLPIKIHGF